MNREELDIIIPVALASDRDAVAETGSSILEQNRRYGFTRFALFMPGKGWRSISYPPHEFFLEKAEIFREVRNRLPEHIRCGWWHTLVLKSGPTPGLTRVVRADGTEAPFSTCPLDPEYRRRFGEDVTAVLKICRPDFLLTEDDFALNCHGGPGCFCRRHLEEFAKREGRFYSREELNELFTSSPTESRELLRRYQLLQRDSLVLFAQMIRAAADRVMPELPIGCDQPGCSEKDGNSIEAVARALAGKNHTPWVRFCGAYYGAEYISKIPARLFNCLYFKQHIPGDFGFYHESDSYPHTRFYISASAMRVFMSLVYSFGYDGSIFQTQQMLDDPNEEPAYGKMFAAERKCFNSLHRQIQGCRVRGIQLHHDPFEAANFPQNGPDWAPVLSAMGIPYTTDEAEVAAISGNQLLFADDRTIRQYLSKGLLLDGQAAKVLCERGYGEFLGVKVTSGLIEGNERFDLGGKEIIEPGFVPDCRGRKMMRGDCFSPQGNGELFRLEITDPACEKITRIYTFQNVYQAPGMTRYRNRLGGKVVVYASGVSNHGASSLFNYRRQKLFQELLCWCADFLPFVKNEARVGLVVNEAPADRNFRGVLTLINLCPDPLEKLELHLPPDWRENIVFKIMDRDGLWQNAPVEMTGDGMILNRPLHYTEPVYLLAEKTA